MPIFPGGRPRRRSEGHNVPTIQLIEVFRSWCPVAWCRRPGGLVPGGLVPSTWWPGAVALVAWCRRPGGPKPGGSKPAAVDLVARCPERGNQ